MLALCREPTRPFDNRSVSYSLLALSIYRNQSEFGKERVASCHQLILEIDLKWTGEEEAVFRVWNASTIWCETTCLNGDKQTTP